MMNYFKVELEGETQEFYTDPKLDITTEEQARDYLIASGYSGEGEITLG